MIILINQLFHIQKIEQVSELSSILLKTSQLLLSLIRDILDYSQIIRSKIRLVSEYFKMDKFLDEIQELFDFQFVEKGINLIIKNKLSKEYMIMKTDQVRLKQIFINFVSNALKYTFSGSVIIDVSQDLPHNNIIKITVIDTGIGIPLTI